MSTIRWTVIEVDRADAATIIGNVEDPSNAPLTTDETTVYILKTYLFSGSEVWVRDPLGNDHRHPAGYPLTHWSNDAD